MNSLAGRCGGARRGWASSCCRAGAGGHACFCGNGWRQRWTNCCRGSANRRGWSRRSTWCRRSSGWRSGDRRDRLRRALSTRRLDRHVVGGVVDNHRVVHVVVDDVVGRRRRDVGRRLHIGRNRLIDRNRQHEQANWRWRWRQRDPERGRGRQEDHRRRWRRCKREHRIIEREYRPIDEHHFGRGRRWHVISHHLERGRRLECGRELCQPAPAIVNVRAARIASQIGPIGVRRVGNPGPSPGNRLAACRDDGLHPRRHRIVRIGRDEIQVALQCVALQRSRVGVLRAEIANRPRAHLLHLLGRDLRRRCIRRAIEELELRHDVRRLPRDFGTLGHLVDAQAHPVKHILRRQAAIANHFRERLGIRAVRSVAVGCDRARRGIERVEHAGFGIDQREPPGERLARLHKRIGAASVQHHHAGLEFERGKRARVIGHPHRLERHIGCLRKLRVNRNVIVLAFELHAIACEINKGDGVGARALRLAEEIAHRLAQRVLIEITRAGDVKARGLQCLCDQAGVVGRGLERACLIARVADHECDALFRTVGRGRCWGSCRCGRRRCGFHREVLSGRPRVLRGNQADCREHAERNQQSEVFCHMMPHGRAVAYQYTAKALNVL